MGEQTGDKTEEPTPHKLREARKKGQIAKSKEITTAVLVLVSYIVFKNTASAIWVRTVSFGSFVFRLIEDSANISNISYAANLVKSGIYTLLLSVMPIFITIFTTTVIIEVFQTQFVVSTESMTPKLSKLNPIEGVKRMFSLKGVVQMILSLAKIIIIFWITTSVIREELPTILGALATPLWGVMGIAGGLVFKIAMRVAMFYIIIALIDYLYQKKEFHKSMMMTKQEVKEEYKRLEGDPVIKQRQRQAQREMSQKRMMGSVPQADVVVTNPVHIAVALKYDTKEMKAPMLLAKGRRMQAQEIKRIAEEHNVPVVENESLAQDIHKTVDVGQEMPLELYRAVAEILAFVYKLGRSKKGPGKKIVQPKPRIIKR